MQKRTKESKKRLNSLILLIAFTAILLIISTYAWFTTQKSVQLTNLKGVVNVADGIQVSLDAKNWTQQIDFDESSLLATVGDDGTPPADTPYYAYKGHHNVVPAEFLPVSTVGEVAANVEGDAAKEGVVVFTSGTTSRDATNAANRQGLKKIVAYDTLAKETALTEDTKDGADIDKRGANGYYAFDLFVKNTARNATTNVLQLTEQSSVLAAPDGDTPIRFTGAEGEKDYGIQNTVRVAFAQYTGTENARTEDPTTIITATDTAIKNVAIWEPNADAHVQTILDTFCVPTSKDLITGLKLRSANETGKTATTNGTYTWTDQADSVFTKTSAFRTYGVVAASYMGESVTDDTLKDIYDWSGTNTKLAIQTTLQTPTSLGTKTTFNSGNADTDDFGTHNLVVADKTEDGVTPFEINANEITKLRVYIWIEGQDPDCINYASFGGGLSVDIGLSKDIEVGGSAAAEL